MQFRGEASYYINHIQFWLKKKKIQKKKNSTTNINRTPKCEVKKHPPAALLICSAFCPSDPRIWACLRPSATLMAASLVPSDSRTVALFFRSASTWPWFMIYQSHNWEEITVVCEMKLKSISSYLHLHRLFYSWRNVNVFDLVSKTSNPPIIWCLVYWVDHIGIQGLSFLSNSKNYP